MKILSGNPMYDELNTLLLTEMMSRIRDNLREHDVDESEISDLSFDICTTISDVLDGTYEVETPIMKVHPCVAYYKKRDGAFYIGPDETSTELIILCDRIT